jgi:hypothetical protein
MENSNSDILKVFCSSELYTGKLQVQNSGLKSSFIEKNVLYRCVFTENTLYFLLYDFSTLFFSQQTIEEILKYNKLTNPSLEFADRNALVTFLIGDIMKAESGLQITQKKNTINFEVLVDIIRVKWDFDCEILEESGNCEFIQNLFARPLLNIVLVSF